MSEELIINEIRNGNKQALAELYKTHRGEFITWLTSHYACSRDEARDIYQASILTFYENILADKLRDLSSSIKTYLFAIGKNKVHELRRSEMRITHQAEGRELDPVEVDSWESEKKEQDLQLVERAMQKLGEPCKTMLQLYYFHGTSLANLATQLNYKNSDTLKNLKCRCLVKLRKLYEEEAKVESLKGIMGADTELEKKRAAQKHGS